MDSPARLGLPDPAPAIRVVTCNVLQPEIDRLLLDGHRLDVIYPADDPHTAILSKEAQRIRVTTRPDAPLPTDRLPPFQPELIVTRADDGGSAGRAGMAYRDLIPGRLGGRYVASHIRIADGGPVADWVHYHRVGFQMIAVRTGWVRVVYEDQGDPFVMQPGDIVLQPPGIRHRVLESSAGLEVIELGCPALHETFADHQLQLPNGAGERNRLFGGQEFHLHRAVTAPWRAFGGGQAQTSGIKTATEGRADVRLVRAADAASIRFDSHDGELVFGFVLAGTARLQGPVDAVISPADAFVIPSGVSWSVCDASDDFRLLHVTTASMPDVVPAIDRRSVTQSA